MAFACLSGSVLAAGRSGTIRGTISDPRGLRLAGVELQIVRASGPASILSTTTNARGKFLLFGLTPGVYLLTASKQGYGSVSSRFNTLIDRSVTLVLPPVLGEMTSEGAPTVMPADSGWVLRLPHRDLLRELEAASVLEEAGGSQGGVERARSGAQEEEHPGSRNLGGSFRLDGDFEHMVSLGSGGTNAGGHTSRLALGAAFGDEIEVSLAALLDDTRFNGDPKGGAGVLEKEHQRELARLGARFAPGSADRVEISAFHDEQRYAVRPQLSAQEGGYKQRLEGYGARWERDLGSRGSMDLSFDYRSVEVVGGAKDAVAGPDPALSFRSAQNQIWQAAGSYEINLDERRRMNINVRARHLRVANPGEVAISAFEALRGVPGDGADRWAFDISGREERSLSGPLSLDYGFHYHRRTEGIFSEASDSAFIPEAGLVFSRPNGTHWSAGVSLALDPPKELELQQGRAAQDAADDGWQSRLGYRLGVRHPFTRHRLTLGFNATYHPYAYILFGEETAALDLDTQRAKPFLISEGNAERLELGVLLEKQFRRFVASLGSQLGQIEGYLATGFFREMPVQDLSYNQIHYVIASARGYQPDSGTLVHVDYQRYLNNPGDAADLSTLSYQFEQLDVALEQDLPSIALWDARWRLMVAYQTLRTGAKRDTDVLALRAAGVLPSESRFRGGIAIRF
ncbi:MAG: carboxypeptidase-like regulatory domain-containing protein [Acidobacteriota bacterium]